MTLEQAIELVETSDRAVVLGVDPVVAYRRLAKIIHPDLVPGAMKTRAGAAFSKLTDMYVAAGGKKTLSEKVIGKWIVSEGLAKGDLCDVYYARRIDDEDKRGVFKLARSAKDSDLMEQEYAALTKLNSTRAFDHTDRGAGLLRYIPEVLERMEVSGRRANVLSLSNESHTLAELNKLFPSGFAFEHIVWMVNRALSALGFIHSEGVVHGAVVPDHLIYGPTSHSLTLADWCYSVCADGKRHVPAVATNWKSLYPPEVSRKMAADPATDIYMLFASMQWVTTARRIPPLFRHVFDWAMASSPRSRPSSAWHLQDRWLQIAEREYGPARYVKLDIPVI